MKNKKPIGTCDCCECAPCAVCGDSRHIDSMLTCVECNHPFCEAHKDVEISKIDDDFVCLGCEPSYVRAKEWLASLRESDEANYREAKGY